MSNPFEKVGHGIEVAAKDVVKGLEYGVTLGGKVIKVVEEVKVLTPAFKSELATLINDAKPIADALQPVIAAGGENVVADVAAVEPIVQDVIKLASDFLKFVPTLEAALKSLEASAS